MKLIYMECTIALLAQDPQNTGKIQELLGSSQHCQVPETDIKYIKFETE